MISSRCFITVFTIAYTAWSVAEDASPQLAQTGTGTAEEGNRPHSGWREWERIDLSERDDLELENDLEKLGQKTQPIFIDLTYSRVGGDRLKHLHGLKNLKRLDLTGTDASDTGLQHLGELPGLEVLHLSGCKVTAEGILQLRSSGKLKHLILGSVRPPIDDNAIKRIASAWPNLESISLDRSQITDAGLSHVGKLRRLRYLNVGGTRITDNGLKSLISLSELRTLHAQHTNITDEGMLHLGAITSLVKLDLNFTGITDRGLQKVGGLKNLKRIYFVGTKVTDEGLEDLKPLKTIEFVGLSGNITDAAEEALKESLPLFKKNKRG